MPDVLLLCGDRAMSVHVGEHDGLPKKHPSCVIHSVCTIDERPINLEGRNAKCYDYGKMPYKNECNYGGKSNVPCVCEQPSSLNLPFFTFRGEGSYDSIDRCKNCIYGKYAHERKGSFADERRDCRHWEPHGPFEYDTFYCGCQSWD